MRSVPRHQFLTPGPLSLGRGKSGKESDTSETSQLMKQQFRKKCQDTMERDRKRGRDQRVAQGRDYRSISDADSDEEYQSSAKAILCSDDLSSSEIDEASMEDRELEVSQ
jgi:hypothetical protein